MKKILLIAAAAVATLQAEAQNINPESDYVQPKRSEQKRISPDSILSRWCIDVNGMGGLMMRRFESSGYTNPDFKNGYSVGGDVQLGYFFGRGRHFGVGTGFLYTYQSGDAVLGQFNAAYQATDRWGNTYRQIVRSTGEVKERISSSGYNIPLLLKYKTRFSDRLGFTADAGFVFNLSTTSNYDASASFDYEAIYRYVPNADGTTTAVYPATTAPGDLIITKAQYANNHNASSIENYFNALRNQGYNVGLGVKPASTTGQTKYDAGSVGLLVRPAVSYYLSDKVAINLGVWYMYQDLRKDAGSAQLTNSVGQYNSIAGSVSSSASHAYGLNLGVRYFIAKVKDSDGDGIPDKRDRCANERGPEQYKGCPDTDGDGIPDIDDACPNIPGTKEFSGCPDTDGDGITDESDECPNQPGPEMYDGCPDTDGDGIPDHRDRCPEKMGPESNQGCPLKPIVKEEEPAIENENDDISTPLMFDVDKNTIRKSSMPAIKRAAKEVKEKKGSYIEVNGYTDNTGSKKYNAALSVRRAAAVKKELQKQGVNPKKVKTIGHGESKPAGDNSTPEGRAMNRRAIMKMRDKR